MPKYDQEGLEEFRTQTRVDFENGDSQSNMCGKIYNQNSGIILYIRMCQCVQQILVFNVGQLKQGKGYVSLKEMRRSILKNQKNPFQSTGLLAFQFRNTINKLLTYRGYVCRAAPGYAGSAKHCVFCQRRTFLAKTYLDTIDCVALLL